MGAIIEVKYFNSFLLKKVDADLGLASGDQVPSWNGSTGIPADIGGYPVISEGDIDNASDWAIEEARIRGGYNNTNFDYGVRAYIVEEEANAVIRGNSLIYSGIFNSRTGINDTNVFSVGDSITKSADPANGSIQKLYAEDTNLIIFQESKVSRALIDKDAIYTAEGSSSISNVNTTIGTIQPYGGNFGISRDPGSFAAYGYRKYFTDKDRNAVLRLSMDGLTEISNYGMYDYFRDEFNNIDQIGTVGQLKGGWDIHNKQYVVSAQRSVLSEDDSYNTLSYDENVRGWTSFFTYKPDQMLSLKNSFYTMKDNGLWQHYSADVDRGSFYGSSTPASVHFVFNARVSMSKVFKTISYEGSNGWQVNNFISDGTGSDVNNSEWPSSFDTTALVKSYDEGSYTENNTTYRVGFNRKENKYHANLVNNSEPMAGEVSWGPSISGVKGFFANVVVSTDSTTDVGGAKELFAVSSNYSESSY